MTVAHRILLVYEPEPFLSVTLQEQLAGWMVHQVSSLEDPSTANVDAALLLTGDSSVVAHALRTAGMIGPIFALGEDMSPPLVALAKPLRIPMLIERLQIQDGTEVDGAVIGPWRLDLGQRAIIDTHLGLVERLTDKEFALLQILLQNAPRTVDRERLQTEIWRYHAEADTHTVETHVWRLRQKLEVDPANPRFLLTGSDGYTISRI